MGNILERVSGFTDKEWKDLLVRSLEENPIDGISLPSFPPLELQERLHGTSGEQALEGAYRLYQEIKTYAKDCGLELNQDSKILDFGCAWGRHLRFFLKDTKPENLFGIDVDRDVLEISREIFPDANFRSVDSSPPSGLPESSFDLIFSNSVFSHLSEEAHLQWLDELAKVLRPGGLLVATTWGRDMLERARDVVGKSEFEYEWHKKLGSLFPDAEDALACHDRGEFIYRSSSGGKYLDASFFGIASIPFGYVKNVWTRNLELKDFVDNPKRFPQALIVMTKS